MPIDLRTIEKAEKELLELETKYKELAADTALTAASMAPPPFGTVADVVSIGKSIWAGDWGGALLDVVGLIPIVGDGIKGVAKGTKIANKMGKVKKAIQIAKTKLARKKNLLSKNGIPNKRKVNTIVDSASTQKCPLKNKRRISKEIYDKLRKATPTQAIRDKINKGKVPPFPDEALSGMTVTKKLEADHIVSMDKITRLEGFGKLTKEEQLSVLNNENNFIGLSKSANTSKGSKSFKEWTMHKKSGTPVNRKFREKMIKAEEELEVSLKKQINDFLK
jgi:hypothetical protein